MVVVVENSTANNKRRRINGQRERFCQNGHKIEKGYPLWYRKRLGNLPMNTSIQCCTCCPIATPAAIISSSSLFHPIITTTTMEQDDDVTWACIDCGFDMCTRCYTSKHSMEVLLHLHNTSSTTRTASSVFPVKEVSDTQDDDDDDNDDVIMKRNDHHYDNPGCISDSRGFQDDKEEEMWHKPSSSTTLSCILLPSMPSKF